MPLARDRTEVEALLTDRYLESLLLAQDGRAEDVPADSALDAAIRRAARRLSRDLVRVHPSFRFEERLAARLAETAARIRLSAAAGAEGAVLTAPFAVRSPNASPDHASPDHASPDHEPVGQLAPASAAFARPLIIGGALTSAAISIAGAAYVAWRRGHPPGSAMARAVRAAQEARLGRLAGSFAGSVASSVAGSVASSVAGSVASSVAGSVNGAVADGAARPRPD